MSGKGETREKAEGEGVREGGKGSKTKTKGADRRRGRGDETREKI